MSFQQATRTGELQFSVTQSDIVDKGATFAGGRPIEGKYTGIASQETPIAFIQIPRSTTVVLRALYDWAYIVPTTAVPAAITTGQVRVLHEDSMGADVKQLAKDVTLAFAEPQDRNKKYYYKTTRTLLEDQFIGITLGGTASVNSSANELFDIVGYQLYRRLP